MAPHEFQPRGFFGEVIQTNFYSGAIPEDREAFKNAAGGMMTVEHGDALAGHAVASATADETNADASVGSENHSSGTCRPCCFWARKKCTLGHACTFCHLPHIQKVRMSKKARERMRVRICARKIALRAAAAEAFAAPSVADAAGMPGGPIDPSGNQSGTPDVSKREDPRRGATAQRQVRQVRQPPAPEARATPATMAVATVASPVAQHVPSAFRLADADHIRHVTESLEAAISSLLASKFGRSRLSIGCSDENVASSFGSSSSSGHGSCASFTLPEPPVPVFIRASSGSLSEHFGFGKVLAPPSGLLARDQNFGEGSSLASIRGVWPELALGTGRVTIRV